jgi:hypothetical protein
MRRSADLSALLAIATGALLSAGATGLARGFVEGYAGFEMVNLLEPPAARAAPREGRCVATFRLHAEPSDWSVVGTYTGAVRRVPAGLEVDLFGGETLAAEQDAYARGLVFGVAERTEAGGWNVVREAEPIPIGALDHGVPAAIGRHVVVIPDVGPDELAKGWLVAEHVLAAPDAQGGTAWTYLHASREAFLPLLDPSCSSVP